MADAPEERAAAGAALARFYADSIASATRSAQPIVAARHHRLRQPAGDVAEPLSCRGVGDVV
jgi:hypothetical protein